MFDMQEIFVWKTWRIAKSKVFDIHSQVERTISNPWNQPQRTKSDRKAKSPSFCHDNAQEKSHKRGKKEKHWEESDPFNLTNFYQSIFENEGR